METKDNIIQTLEELNASFLGDKEDRENAVERIFGALIALDDDKFELVAPIVQEQYLKTINTPEYKLVLAQYMNAGGHKIEELGDLFTKFAASVDAMEDLTSTKKDFFKVLVSSICNAVSDTQGISKKIVRIAVEKCHEDAKMPEYANLTDSGMDIYAIEDVIIKPGETVLVHTGIKAQLPPGYELQVRPKSGISLKSKMRIGNAPGTVDAGYRGEICVIIDNIEPRIRDIESEYDDNGNLIIKSIEYGKPMYIAKGQKFAQLVLAEVIKAACYEVSAVVSDTTRGEGGFGSTGLN